MSDDTIKDDDEKEVDGDIGEVDSEIEGGSAEPDFAPTAAAPIFDEEDDAVADPHSAFDEHVSVVEDPHQDDIYGDAGAPLGYNEDEEEDDEEDMNEDY